ncbi:ABC transporter permease [Candidatus Micrarchaeota archaeon]|nr:ABC transporter permease [Candidatus Micrarchaeota archaeon]
MEFSDLIEYSFVHLKHRGIRTWLTLLGIVVGISSFILLVGIVDGMNASIQEKMGEFGSDIFTISPGGNAREGGPPGMGSSMSADKLYLDDVETIEKVDGVGTVSPVLSVSVELEYRDKTSERTVTGVDLETYEDTNVMSDLLEGRYLVSSDKGAVLVGSSLIERTFSGKVGLNSRIEIDDKQFKIIGILDENSSMGGMGGGSIYIPIDDARDLAGDSIASEEVSKIQVKIDNGYNLTAVVDDVEEALMEDHGVSKDDMDFTITSSVLMEAQRTEILGTLTLFLGLVSAVSLLVGGIGISNTMFMSVLERTREIGLLKALGATSSQIRNIFLVEAVVIGLLGGILGILAGYLLLQAVSLLGYEGHISEFMLAISFGVSLGVGAAAGTYPARSATRVPAIEALRYE